MYNSESSNTKVFFSDIAFGSSKIVMFLFLKLAIALFALSPITNAHVGSAVFSETNDRQNFIGVYWSLVLHSEPIEAITMTPSGEWMIATASQIHYSEGFSPGVQLTLNYSRWFGQKIEAVAFAPNGASVVVTDTSVYMSGSVPYKSQLKNIIESHQSAGKKINAISFTSNNSGWVVLTDDTYHTKNAPSQLIEALKDTNHSKRKLRHVDMSSDGRWVVVAEDWFASSGLSSTAVTALRRWQRQAKDISYISLGKGGDHVAFSTKDYIPTSDAGRVEHGLMNNATRTNIWQAMEDLNVPGLAMAWRGKNGLRYVRSYGVERKGTQQFVRYNTIFTPASLSKYVTAVVLARLKERGELNWSDNVLSLARSKNGPLSAWSNQFFHLDGLKIGHLLSHTSGIEEKFWLSYKAPSQWPNGRLATTEELVSGDFCRRNFACENTGKYGLKGIPGDAYEYQNANYNLAAFIAEHLTGDTFSDLANELVFEPLNMTHSAYAWPLPSHFKSRLIYPYDVNGVETPQLAAALPAAGMVTTPADYMKVLEILLDEGRKPNGDYFLMPWTVRDMLISHTPRGADNYGYGLRLSQSMVHESSGEFVHEGLADVSARGYMWGKPSKDIGFVVMGNGRNAASTASLAGIAADMRSAFQCFEDEDNGTCFSRGLPGLPPLGGTPISFF